MCRLSQEPARPRLVDRCLRRVERESPIRPVHTGHRPSPAHSGHRERPSVAQGVRPAGASRPAPAQSAGKDRAARADLAQHLYWRMAAWRLSSPRSVPHSETSHAAPDSCERFTASAMPFVATSREWPRPRLDLVRMQPQRSGSCGTRRRRFWSRALRFSDAALTSVYGLTHRVCRVTTPRSSCRGRRRRWKISAARTARMSVGAGLPRRFPWSTAPCFSSGRSRCAFASLRRVRTLTRPSRSPTSHARPVTPDPTRPPPPHRLPRLKTPPRLLLLQLTEASQESPERFVRKVLGSSGG